MRTAPTLGADVATAVAVLASQHLLLSAFAQFYDTVVRVKEAAHRGVLADYLAVDGTPLTQPDAQARALSALLCDRLQDQARAMERSASEAQLRAYDIARYVMAVLADEICIFELRWPAQDEWLNVLLEYRQFQSRRAGQHFFVLAEQLLDGNERGALQRDLAACFLLALQLGFKGKYRGPQGLEALELLRARLVQFALADVAHDGPLLPNALFAQAYAHTKYSAMPVRLAPLGPWLHMAALGGLACVAVSCLIWWIGIQPIFSATQG